MTIDLRSDTVTTPTERMREAMRAAAVGDDVLGEDPTVRELERLAAERFEKEAALFLVSGTMANQAAVLTLTDPGDQVVLHRNSHLYNLEGGGLAATCGVQVRVVETMEGRISSEALEAEIQPAGLQEAPTTLLCLENSFDLNRGLAVPADHLEALGAFARAHGLRVYLDGARIFNAAIALDTDVAALSAPADLVAVSLSKGLSCPVGSLLVGSEDLIRAARRMRQRLGGGWRQAGILAAAGIVGLQEMVERLREDHANARRLAEGLVAAGFSVDLQQVQTNIVLLDLRPQGMRAREFCRRLAQRGVRARPVGPWAVRMVTHKDVQADEIPLVVEAAHAG